MLLTRTVYCHMVLQVLAILLILSKGHCNTRHIVEVGNPYSAECSSKSVKISGSAVVHRVDIYHEKDKVYEIGPYAATKTSRVPKYDKWEVDAKNIEHQKSKTRNEKSFSVNVKILQLQLTDEGTISCKVHYSTQGFTTSYVKGRIIAALYVQDKGNAPCKDRWVYSSKVNLCYKAFNRSLTWYKAGEYCRDIHNGKMPSIHSPNTDNFLTALIGPAAGSKFWIGLTGPAKQTDIQLSKKFESKYRGTGVQRKASTTSGPSRQNCLVFKGNQDQDVVDCREKNMFICQASPEALTIPKDEDEEGGGGQKDAVQHLEVMAIFVGLTTATLLAVCGLLAMPRAYVNKCFGWKTNSESEGDGDKSATND